MDPPSDLPAVLLLAPLPPFFHGPGGLSGRFRLLKLWETPPSQDASLASGSEVASTRVLLCATPRHTVGADLLARLPSLELVMAPTVGVNHIDLDECRRRRIAVANVGSVFTDDTADYAVGLLIDVLRRVSAADRYMRHGLWPTRGEYPFGSKLGGKRVGIVGLGSIGSAVAKRLEAFGCSISYYSRAKKPFVPYKFVSTILDLASRSDVLVLSCALTDETYHIINKEVMLALGKDGIIINIGRGKLIDEKELVTFLMQGQLQGAGLDVFENEPDVPEELLVMDNVILSPHNAVATPDSFHGVYEVVIANLEAFFSNMPLISPVLE